MSERLSPTQRVALAALRRNPGYGVDDYPGGKRTMRALVRRGFARLEEHRVGQWLDTRAFPTPDPAQAYRPPDPDDYPSPSELADQ